VPLEILNGTLVLERGRLAGERAEVSALAGLGIELRE
jgi:hypothetical protein